ncbi:hypothetical protein AAC387_Pa03g0775 [Persea americana]
MGAGESKVSTALAVVAFVGLAAGAIYKLCASGASDSNKKTTKAPGRDGFIPRHDFEHNPNFRGLRKRN